MGLKPNFLTGFVNFFSQTLPIISDDLSIENTFTSAAYHTVADNLILSANLYLQAINSLEDNVRISNHEFAIKREAYQNSSIILTKSISEFNEWTIEIIKQRQDSMFEIAADIWPINSGN